MPKYALEILCRFFRNCSFEFHDIANEDLFLHHAFVPSLVHQDHFFHPAMNEFASDMIAHPLTQAALRINVPAERIYVTRKNFRSSSTSYKRTIENEDEVIALLYKYGFKIVYPEELSWEMQITTFAQARVVVGESGSGLHNAIFSGIGTAVVCLNPNNQVQMTIGALRRHVVIIQCSDVNQSNKTLVYHVDVDRLKQALTLAIEQSILVK